MDTYRFWCERRDLPTAAALPCILFHSATEITDFSTRLVLLSKNVPTAHFINAKTLSGSSPNKKAVSTNALTAFWCERRDLNPYESPHTPLKRARLPIPPLSRQRKEL